MELDPLSSLAIGGNRYFFSDFCLSERFPI